MNSPIYYNQYMHQLINGKNIHYEKIGEGRPILFVHGWGGSIKSLRPLATLVAKDRQAILIDLPGFGHSQAPDPDWGVKEYSKLLIDFIQSQQFPQFDFFGHSFGGGLGIFIASQYPKYINHLILCNSALQRTGKTSKKAQLAKKLLENQLLPPKLTFFLRKLSYRIFFPNSDLIRHPHLESNFRKIMTEDLTNYLNKITAKTLILWGGNDKDTPVSYAHVIHEKIKDSSLKIFVDQTHGLPLHHPELLYPELQKFLKI
jgi:pimeloyl-ACP methyl ester carboxylesterase